MQCSEKRQSRISRQVITAFLLVTIAGTGLAYADDLKFSSDPMETKVTAPPANIMFVLDNSGSMDWSFMAPESDGLFHNQRNLWDMADNNSSTVMLGAERLEWQSQWAGYNRLYYNPDTNYLPWPLWNGSANTEAEDGERIKDGGNYPPAKANMVTPRSFPLRRSPTLNLHETYFDTSAVNAVIIDNRDGAPSFTSDFPDSSGRYRPNWAGSYTYTSRRGDVASFNPQNLEAGGYTVWAYWPCNDSRDTNAQVTLDVAGNQYTEYRNQRASANNTPEADVCGQWISLFNGAVYNLPAGNGTSLSIIRQDNSSGLTQADAIAFLPQPATVVTSETLHVRNAHYYVVNDVDENGPDNGEVYLVNFEWTDSDSDGRVDDGEVLRHYYLAFSDDDCCNHEDLVYVQEVYYDSNDPGNDGVPDAVQPRSYDRDGNATGFVSDYDELQNFANWFSFYRRREYTAKAAIGRTIVDLEEVYVGFNTLHRVYDDGDGRGAKQPVLPIKVLQSVYESASTIVDNRDNTGFTTEGSWSESDLTPEWQGSSYYSNDTSGKARFTPTITEAGQYQVSAFWNCYSSRDTNARIVVNHKLGLAPPAYYNQRASSSNTVTEGDCSGTSSSVDGCCGYWVDLGSFFFDVGTSGYVEIQHHSGSHGGTDADAVRFEIAGVTNYQKVDQTGLLLDVLYSIDSAGGTPLRDTLQEVGEYYDQDDGSNGGIGDCPYLSKDNGGACQQAYTVAMTDGYWNGLSPGIGNQDGGMGVPYQDAWSDTLADVAMRYYNTDLASGLANEMATNNYDKRKSQHMVTFSVAFGLEGNIALNDINGDGIPDDPSYADDPYFLLNDTPKPVWPQPGENADSTIDDLWHASVNGRGKFFSAKNPDTLVAALKETFADIGARKASGASVSVNGDELNSGLVLYQSSYKSGSWLGDVAAYPINATSGEILRDEADILWQASDKLQNQDWNTGRNLITFTGSAGVPFRYSSLSTAQQDVLKNNADAVNYLRGQEVTGFRERELKAGAVTAPLGDLVHSAPLLISALNPATDGIDNDGDGTADQADEKGGTIYAGGNDGMLHALNAQTGKERFAYFPLRSFDYLYDLAKPDYEHRFYVDGRQSFKRLKFMAGNLATDGEDNNSDGVVDDVGENYGDDVDNDGDNAIDEAWEYKDMTLLVGTLNKGGRGVYALDVTNAESVTGASPESTTAASMVMWEYPPIGTDGIHYVFAGDQTSDGVDNDGDGCIDGAGCPTGVSETDDGDDEDYSDGYDNNGNGLIDEEGEMWLTNVTSTVAAENDGVDNDGDGIVDEAGEVRILNAPDDDMGYTYGDAFVARSYRSTYEGIPDSTNPDKINPWVVVFGNGYQSKNGHAVLYVVDALDGTLIRKIVTGPAGNNGLSSPTLIDVNNDDRVDFVYAGDLAGNMWKFDLRASNPEDWGVFYGIDNSDPSDRIDYQDINSNGIHDDPKPLISVGRTITTAPDVAYQCDANLKGYMVAFGTGKYLGEDDRTDKSQQGIFGIWDFGTQPTHYLGTWTKNAPTNYFTDFDSDAVDLSQVTLLEQVEIDWWETDFGSLRTLSNYEPIWDATAECNDKLDNDSDGIVDNEACVPLSGSNVGWFFDLPYNLGQDGIDNDSDGQIDEDDEDATLAGERVIKDIIIRDGKVIVISFIPGESPCDGGGNSIVHEMSLCNGGRLLKPVFDINDDGIINDDDLIVIEIDDPDNPGQRITIQVAPTGKMYDGILHTPVIVSDPDETGDSTPRELKIFSSSAGTTEVMWERKEELGFYYWREH